MCVEETISPSTSTSSATRVLERVLRPQQLRVALGAVAEAEVLPHRDRSAPRPLDQLAVDELLGGLGGEGAVERDHDELAHAEAGDQVGLDRQRRQQLRRGVRRDHEPRVRLEGEHGVGAADDLAVADVHAVELAHGEVALARARVGEPGDVHQPRKPTTGLSRSAPARLGDGDQAVRVARAARRARPARPGTATPWAARRASSPSRRTSGQERERVVERHDPLLVGVGDLERADRGPAQLEAVGVAEVGDQRAHVGARGALDQRGPRGRPRARAARSASRAPRARRSRPPRRGAPSRRRARRRS